MHHSDPIPVLERAPADALAALLALSRRYFAVPLACLEGAARCEEAQPC